MLYSHVVHILCAFLRLLSLFLNSKIQSSLIAHSSSLCLSIEQVINEDSSQYALSDVNVDIIQLGLTFLDQENLSTLLKASNSTSQATAESLFIFIEALTIAKKQHKMTESIYKFVEQPHAKKAKKQIYKSKYDPNGPLIGSTFCMQGTTVVDGKGFHSLKQVSLLSAFVVVVVLSLLLL